MAEQTPVIESVQPPQYITDVPRHLTWQLVAVMAWMLILLVILISFDAPPLVMGFMFLSTIVVLGIAWLNTQTMKETSGIQTRHIVESRNAELESQTAITMLSAANKLDKTPTVALQAPPTTQLVRDRTLRQPGPPSAANG